MVAYNREQFSHSFLSADRQARPEASGLRGFRLSAKKTVQKLFPVIY